MKAVVGALRVNMGLETGRFDAGIDRARKKTDGIRLAFDNFRYAGRKLGNALSQLGFQYVGFLAIKDGFNRLMRQGSGEIDAVAKAARRLDGSIGGIRALELVASEAGVSSANLADEFSKLERVLVSGTENSRKAMRRLGLSIQDLDGKDIDARIALIADRIKGLGLSSAEASHMLKQLGVTNQDMILLMRQGGDAIREARKDIDDYRAGLSQVDVQAVERGRDQISRLGIVIKSVSQEVIGQTVPRLGQFAQAITDSMREGGKLREIVDVLLRSLDRLAIIAAVTATIFTIKYVTAMVLARVATLNLAAAVATLGRALKAIGIAAAVLLLSELIFLFVRLREAVGGTKEAFLMIRNVWSEVVDRMKMGLELFVLDWQIFQQEIQVIWLSMLSFLRDHWTRFLNTIGPAINKMSDALRMEFRIDLEGAQQGKEELAALLEQAKNTRMELGAAYVELQEAILSPLTSIEKIREALANFNKELPENEQAVFRLSEGFEGFGNGLLGTEERLAQIQNRLELLRRSLDPTYDESMRYAEALNVLDQALKENIISTELYAQLVEKLNDSFLNAKEGSEELGNGLMSLEDIGARVKDSMADTFASIVTGAQNGKDAIAGLLRSIAQMIAKQAVLSMLGGMPIPGFARGTNFAPGGMALVGEQGPELVNLPRGSQVVPSSKTGEMLRSETSVSVQPKIVNVLDPSLVGDYLATREGERLIVNVLQRNGVAV